MAEDLEAAGGDRPQSYEHAREELAGVVQRLETGGLTLEESLRLWERGERLAAVCEQWLEGARARLTAAMAERDGDRDGEGPGEQPANGSGAAPF